MHNSKQYLQTKYSTRQYMLSKDFEVFYYSNLKMHDVNAHSHDYYEFYLFIGGDVILTIGNEEQKLSPGDLVVIPPHVMHKLTIRDNDMPYQRLIFWITQDFCNSLMDISRDYGYLPQHAVIRRKYIYHLDMFGFNSIQTKFLHLLEELQCDRFGKEAKVSICVNDLFFSLNRVVYELENPKKEKEEQNLYENVQTYIEENITQELTLDSIAENLGLNKFHIAHVFKDNLGISLHQYILKKRLALGKSIISSGTEISESYLQCGFNDYSSFFRAFKKEFGLSPKEFRNQLKLPSDSYLENGLNPS